MKKTLGKMLVRGLRVTAVILGLAYVLWVAAIYASLRPPPHGLLWFLETYISHDGQISDPQGVLRQIMIVPGLVLSVFIIGQVTLRAFAFPGRLLVAYAVFMVLYYSFFRWYVMMVLGNGPFEDSLLEWGGFACAFAAAVLFAVSGMRGIRAAYLLALAFFLFAMEEISWGQRLIGASGPDFITRHNLQSETNLHNFLSRDYFVPVYFTANILAFLALTWARRLDWLSPIYGRGNLARIISASDRWGIWIIPLFLSLASIFPGEEFVEEQWSFLGLFLAVLVLWGPKSGFQSQADIRIR